MRYLAAIWFVLLSLFPWPGVLAKSTPGESGGIFRQPDAKAWPDLFVWSDTCNVYVLRDGDAALLIDLGDGRVLDHLQDIGIQHVEWVLFTHHHREQCQGAPRLRGSTAKVAAPEAERALFEQPADFRKMKVSLRDAFTIHGSSYVRPPILPILLDRTLKAGDNFSWRGRIFRCEETPGNSPGSLSYLLPHQGRWLAFSGDVMLAGARMHTWFDTEWDYGFAAGIHALQSTVKRLATMDITWLLPAHGPVMRAPKQQWREFDSKLQRLERLYVRGYGVGAASVASQDKVSTPTVVSDVWQVSPHLFKFKRPNFFPNFGLILADNGHALVVDCGLLDEKFLDTALDGLRANFGLKQIDAVIITHMHGDHFLEAPYLRKKWGAPIWALDRMAAVCEHPEWFDYAAPIQAYGKPGVDRVHFDRLFKSGETFLWEGHQFTVDWLPGQTEFALCLHGQIDGRKVAFTGDNIFGNPDDPGQSGHEAVVAHNSAILEEGYIYGAEYLSRLKPDIMVGGHSFVMNHPAAFIERFRKWSYAMRDAFKALSSEKDYRYWFDPFWVRVEPYRVAMTRGSTAVVTLNVRNFLQRSQPYRFAIRCPLGVVVEPAILEGVTPARTTVRIPLSLKATADAKPGVHIAGLDMTIDDQLYGQRFDFIIGISTGEGSEK